MTLDKERPGGRGLLPFALAAECAALALLPGRGQDFLSGVPLTTLPQYAVFLVIAFNVLLYVLAPRHGRHGEAAILNPFADAVLKPLDGFLRRRHAVLFALALVLKIFLFASNYFQPPDVFRYCYTSPGAGAVILEGCFFSPENPFKIDGATYLSDNFQWDSEGGLERWYRNDLLYRDKPVTVEARGYVDAPGGGRLWLEYAGAVKVSVDGRTYSLASAATARQELQVSSDAGRAGQISSGAGPHSIAVRGQLKRPLRFKLLWETAGVFTAARPFSTDGASGMPGASGMAGAGGGIAASAVTVSWALCFVVSWVFVTALVLQLLAAVRFNKYALWAFALAPVMYFAPPIAAFSVLMVCVYFAALHEKHRRSEVDYIQWCIVLFALTAVFVFHHYDAGAAIIRAAGHDPLTYDTFGRSALREASLRAGEDVFYYQPGFRYFMALELLTFGERNVFPLFVNLATFVSALVMFFVWLDGRIRPNVLTWASSALFLLVTGRDGVYLVTFNLSEYPSWSLMLAAVMMLYRAADMRDGPLCVRPKTPAPREVYAAAAMLGVAAAIRPNQAIGLLSILALWAVLGYRNDGLSGACFRAALAGMAIYAAILCLPLMHNLYYGKSFVIFSQSLTSDPTTYVYHPREFLQVFTSEESRRKLWFQISHLLVLRKWLVYDMNILKTTLYNLVLAAFLASSAYRLWRGDRMLVLAGWAVVLCFAGVHIIYQVDNYYPRHIIVIYMLMAAFASVFFGGRRAGAGEGGWRSA